jgi:hypothetical protein
MRGTRVIQALSTGACAGDETWWLQPLGFNVSHMTLQMQTLGYRLLLGLGAFHCFLLQLYTMSQLRRLTTLAYYRNIN